MTDYNDGYIFNVLMLYNMTWIFGLFLMTPCALTGCHIVINKQEDGSTPGQSGRTGV